MFILVLCTPLSCNILTQIIVFDLHGPPYVQILAPPLEDRAETFKERHPCGGVETIEKALMECSSERKPFFGGDSIGYVDVALGGYLAWIKEAVDEVAGTSLFDEAKFPRASPRGRSTSRRRTPSGTYASPAVEDIVVFYKKMQAAEGDQRVARTDLARHG